MSQTPVVDAGRGLTATEVAERVAAGRTNDAPDPRSRSLADIVRANTLTSFNVVIGSLWALMFIAQAPIPSARGHTTSPAAAK